MIEINRELYVPLTRIEKYTGVPKDKVFEWAKEKTIRWYTINGHIFVALEHVKKKAKESLLNEVMRCGNDLVS